MLLHQFTGPLIYIPLAAAVITFLLGEYRQLILRVKPLEPAVWIRIVLTASTVLAANELHELVRGPRYFRS